MYEHTIRILCMVRQSARGDGSRLLDYVSKLQRITTTVNFLYVNITYFVYIYIQVLFKVELFICTGKHFICLVHPFSCAAERQNNTNWPSLFSRLFQSISTKLQFAAVHPFAMSVSNANCNSQQVRL